MDLHQNHLYNRKPIHGHRPTVFDQAGEWLYRHCVHNVKLNSFINHRLACLQRDCFKHAFQAFLTDKWENLVPILCSLRGNGSTRRCYSVWATLVTSSYFNVQMVSQWYELIHTVPLYHQGTQMQMCHRHTLSLWAEWCPTHQARDWVDGASPGYPSGHLIKMWVCRVLWVAHLLKAWLQGVQAGWVIQSWEWNRQGLLLYSP